MSKQIASIYFHCSAVGLPFFFVHVVLGRARCGVALTRGGGVLVWVRLDHVFLTRFHVVTFCHGGNDFFCLLQVVNVSYVVVR